MRAHALKRGYRAIAVFPLVAFGSMRGVFTLCAEEADFFGEYETTSLENLASDISYAIEVMERDDQLGRWQIALFESERQLSAIYSNVSNAMFYLAAEPVDRYRIISVNKALLRAFSLTAAEIVNKIVRDVMKESEYAAVLEHYHKAIREHQTVSWQKTFILATGKMYVEISITPIFDGKGNCTNLVGTIHDITNRNSAEGWRKVSRRTLITSSKLQTTYTSFLSLGRKIFSKLTAKHAKSSASEERK